LHEITLDLDWLGLLVCVGWCVWVLFGSSSAIASAVTVFRELVYILLLLVDWGYY